MTAQPPIPPKPQHHVYILRCANNSYYVGSTTNLTLRIEAHNAGRAATHTRKHRPVTLVYSESAENLLAATKRERQLKRWTREKKEALIAGDKAALKRLSRCRG